MVPPPVASISEPWSISSWSFALIFVNGRVAWRARFPAAMHPKPLVRIAPHVIFDHTRKSLRIFADISRVFACLREFDSRLEAQAILAKIIVPMEGPRHNRRACMLRETCEPCRRTRRDAEKID